MYPFWVAVKSHDQIPRPTHRIASLNKIPDHGNEITQNTKKYNLRNCHKIKKLLSMVPSKNMEPLSP